MTEQARRVRIERALRSLRELYDETHVHHAPRDPIDAMRATADFLSNDLNDIIELLVDLKGEMAE